MRAKKTMFAALKAVVFILPFVVGAIGFYNADESVMDSLYSSLTLYPINMSSDKRNVLIEIARWTAPLATAGGLFFLFRNALTRLADAIKTLTGGATAVYGDGAYAETLRRNLKKSVRGNPERINGTKDHILIFDNEVDTLAFYYAHERDFANKRVFIRLDGIDPGNLRERTPQIFSVSDITARLYWREHPLLSYYAGRRLRASVAIIGFERLGQRILDCALLNNIYAPDQQVEYHIWGASARYEAAHTQLGSMAPDTITFHGSEWEKDGALLTKMDRIIVCGGCEKTLPLLDSLITLCPGKDIHANDTSGHLLERFLRHDRLRCFGAIEAILTEETIKTDVLYRAAKLLNYRYYVLYDSKTPANGSEREMEEQWNALDGFTKRANIAAADYHALRLKMIERIQQDGLTPTQRELDELEHMRWCRYHYLNNWRYGIPENGKAKDAALRIHRCLVPFMELPDAEKEKDTETIKLLMEISRDMDIFKV